MKKQLEQRLAELKTQFEQGRKLLNDLEAQQANLRTSLLRLSGAIEILEELLAKENQSRGNGVEQPDGSSEGNAKSRREVQEEGGSTSVETKN